MDDSVDPAILLIITEIRRVEDARHEYEHHDHRRPDHDHYYDLGAVGHAVRRTLPVAVGPAVGCLPAKLWLVGVWEGGEAEGPTRERSDSPLTRSPARLR
ncbi:MAG: hypothetical protein Q8P41_09865 [Pseudomonadota bacterium]|nr:hypothetical protein [Pseudomonadota bacterium]